MLNKTLTVYNTQTRQKEVFEPVDPADIKMYVCGPTVYNYIHIGNARPVVVFDTLYRVLKTLFPKVTYARNITDIDDKIMAEAKVQGVDIDVISQKYAKAYEDNVLSLNSLIPDHVPHATEYVDNMIGLTKNLVDKGFGYESDGHVLFSVEAMESYGKLSNRSLEDMMAGVRVEVADYKRHPGDFVLWKPSSDDQPGWESPWGRGRPGWHLECSAMIETIFGNTIDIHGGGKDLVFPHHENERAQSECAHDGEQFVKYWMHNGYLNIDGEKMSKSLGNFKTVQSLLEQFDGEVLRFALLSSQYRSDADFSAELLAQAKANLDSLYGALQASQSTVIDDVNSVLSDSTAFDALLDDLNTPLAISELLQLAKMLNKNPTDARVKAELVAVSELLGILQKDPDAWFTGRVSAGDASEIDTLVQARYQAKLDKNWAKADEIRDQLKQMGVEVLDSKDGSTWRKI